MYPIYEVIIVDSGEDALPAKDYSAFNKFRIEYIRSEKSVCIQRNIGIRKATSDWVFLCDDDIEIPEDYLEKLVKHIEAYPATAAVSGSWLQKEGEEWKATYPENSAARLIWKYIFQLSIWGEINSAAHNVFTKKVKKYYGRRGNHISRAGWPVLTDFSGEYFTTPVYSLGASLVKKEWLIHSPFDEVLDRFGIGDNYGVIVDFPVPVIHVLNNTVVYHHQEPMNRLQRPLQYYRRALALDYFIKTKKNLEGVKRISLLWSLIGNLVSFIFSGNWGMIKPGFKSAWKIALGKNPYYTAAKKKQKVLEPGL